MKSMVRTVFESTIKSLILEWKTAFFWNFWWLSNTLQMLKFKVIEFSLKKFNSFFLFRIQNQWCDKHLKISHFPYNTNLVWFGLDFCGYEENSGTVKNQWNHHFIGFWILLLYSGGNSYWWQVLQYVSWKSLIPFRYWSYKFVASLWIFDCLWVLQETTKESFEWYNLYNWKSVSE